ncbi:hypothetical protein HMPREF0670_02437 [Prevotella sp. oral taxon 317 str. F0108]|nr:hypothetical protein HMPREF0670_02437 [Prevotella sp. oral taxon 317 str. F0108]
MQEECKGQAQSLGKQLQAKGMAVGWLFASHSPHCTPTQANPNAG